MPLESTREKQSGAIRNMTLLGLVASMAWLALLFTVGWAWYVQVGLIVLTVILGLSLVEFVFPKTEYLRATQVIETYGRPISKLELLSMEPSAKGRIDVGGQHFPGLATVNDRGIGVFSTNLACHWIDWVHLDRSSIDLDEPGFMRVTLARDRTLAIRIPINKEMHTVVQSWVNGS